MSINTGAFVSINTVWSAKDVLKRAGLQKTRLLVKQDIAQNAVSANKNKNCEDSDQANHGVISHGFSKCYLIIKMTRDVNNRITSIISIHLDR